MGCINAVSHKKTSFQELQSQLSEKLDSEDNIVLLDLEPE